MKKIWFCDHPGLIVVNGCPHEMLICCRSCSRKCDERCKNQFCTHARQVELDKDKEVE